MSEIIFREATKQDIPILVNNVEKLIDYYKTLDSKRCILSKDYVSEQTTWLNGLIGNKDSKIFVAVNEDTIVGQIIISIQKANPVYVWKKKGMINAVYVIPDFRKKKIASKLMELAKNFALANAVDYLTLDVKAVNFGAINFYESIGFKEVSKIMELKL